MGGGSEMKRKLVVAFSITILALAAQAHAAAPSVTFKQPPTTGDERAIAQVLRSYRSSGELTLGAPPNITPKTPSSAGFPDPKKRRG